MASVESYELLLRAVRSCEDKKAEDIRILELDPTESGLSDFFVICSGTNTRQNVAITDEVELQLKREFGVYPHSVEGRREGDWILMDYVDFILHVFTPEKREFYGLERLRKSATTVSPDELDAELKRKVKESRSRSGGSKQAEAGEAAAQAPVKAKRASAKKAVDGAGAAGVVTRAGAKRTVGKKVSAAAVEGTEGEVAARPAKRAKKGAAAASSVVEE